jgi:antitoxin (DNA-binding transcriptional repressor) of toxin-antitoxin stability system
MYVILWSPNKEIVMTYLTVKDMKQTRDLWQRLGDEREIVITRDGKPCAVMVDVSPDTCEEALSEIRRALFSGAVSRIRRKAGGREISQNEVDAVIAESRLDRGLTR